MHKNKVMLAVFAREASCLAADYPRTCPEYAQLFQRADLD